MDRQILFMEQTIKALESLQAYTEAISNRLVLDDDSIELIASLVRSVDNDILKLMAIHRGAKAVAEKVGP